MKYKYITQAYYADGSQLLGSDGSSFGTYANDHNAIRYMTNTVMWKFRNTGAVTIKLYRYTNIYDDKTFKLIKTWDKQG